MSNRYRLEHIRLHLKNILIELNKPRPRKKVINWEIYYILNRVYDQLDELMAEKDK